MLAIYSMCVYLKLTVVSRRATAWFGSCVLILDELSHTHTHSKVVADHAVLTATNMPLKTKRLGDGTSRVSYRLPIAIWQFNRALWTRRLALLHE